MLQVIFMLQVSWRNVRAFVDDNKFSFCQFAGEWGRFISGQSSPGQASAQATLPYL